MPTSGTSGPYTALFTKRKSPMSSVCSMLPEGIRNASTRNVRMISHATMATAIDLTHSTRVESFFGSAAAGPGAAGRCAGDAVIQSSRR